MRIRRWVIGLAMAVMAAVDAGSAAAGDGDAKGGATAPKEAGAQGTPAAAQGTPKGGAGGGDEQRRRAAALFDRATVLYEEDRCADAEPLFQAAWDLVQVHDIAANLGECEVELGQMREAAEHLTFALRTFRISGKEEVRARLVKLLDQARKKVGAVRVSVNVEGAEVFVNGRSVGRAPLADPVFVEPGTVTVEGRVPGYVRIVEKLTVLAGEEKLVVATLTREAPSQAPPPEQPQETARARKSMGKSMVPVYIGAGVTGVAVVTGIVLSSISNAASSEASELRYEISSQRGANGCVSPANDSRCEELRSAVRREDAFGNAAIATFIIGTTALLGSMGYGLYWPEPAAAPEPKKETRPSAQVLPSLGHTGGGVVVSSTAPPRAVPLAGRRYSSSPPQPGPSHWQDANPAAGRLSPARRGTGTSA